MQVFEIVIALLLGGAGLAALARRIGSPYPALVALAGAALALVPGTPVLVLDPELALALFVAPVLLDAAFDSSPRDLRANWRPVAGLALGAVALTIVAVALAARALVPDMPWAAAVALGAIVARGPAGSRGGAWEPALCRRGHRAGRDGGGAALPVGSARGRDHRRCRLPTGGAGAGLEGARPAATLAVGTAGVSGCWKLR
jgi:hypothetical protein